MAEGLLQQEPPALDLSFSDLPDEVLALIVSLGLTDAGDVASFASTSKRCAAVCKAAPLRLGVLVSPGVSPREGQAQARTTLQALCASWPGTAELDLRGSPLEDHDVLAALSSCPSLASLLLSDMRKLTPAFTASLAGQQPPANALRMLTLQRCFQLNTSTLTDLLAAAGQPSSKLACVALSHLVLADWAAPELSPQLPPALPKGTGLRMLALHNCSKVGSRALQAIAAACPNLEVWMLGGSALMPPADEQAAGAADVASDATSDGCGSSGGGASAPALLPSLLRAADASVLEAAPTLGAMGCLRSYVASVAAMLAAAASQLPRLRVLELTCSLQGLAPTLQHLAATDALLVARSEPLQVWDLATPASLARALKWLRDTYARYCAAGTTSSSGSIGGSGSIAPSDAAAFLAAAVNCSSASRQTPLHAAAEEANTSQLEALLRLGAHVDARDRSGATPLFLACEAGHAGVVAALLAHGANATLRNSAGEAPLYIASLKGHEQVVEVLLLHCQERGISWQSQSLYDVDGWTPLMAAAVGGRTAIVLKLLEAAGPAAGQLVQAANRYGQTAVHVAARKGSASLLRPLVDAGGAATLLTADCEGKTAAEIARRNGNGSAMRVLGDASSALRREQQRQRGTVPKAERPRPNDPNPRSHQGGQRWVGRRLQQRKGAGGA